MKTTRLEVLYAKALCLYPAVFRMQYADAMQQTLHDALADSERPQRNFTFLLVRDLTTSLLKEHFSMLRETFLRPALIFNAVVLSGISTVLAIAIYVIPQQVLRQSANDPQIELAENFAQELNSGSTVNESLRPESVDLSRSLSPFLMAFDQDGKPVASQAKLSGKIPVPPKGVFDYVRSKGEERFSWEPQPGARFAAVMLHIPGDGKNVTESFVLAGRSLREVEIREKKLGDLAFFNWVVMMGLVVVGSVLFGWFTRPRAVKAAV
jgi:hypothetical protein